MNAWMSHLKKVREQNGGKSLKECMQLAKKTYKRGGSAELSEVDKPLTGGKRKSKTSSKGKRTKKARKGKKKAKKSVKRRSRRSRK